MALRKSTEGFSLLSSGLNVQNSEREIPMHCAPEELKHVPLFELFDDEVAALKAFAIKRNQEPDPLARAG